MGLFGCLPFLCLITGMLWDKPMWGTYWVWDPKLVSELLMLFLYLGYMELRASFDDITRADRVSGMLAVVGFVLFFAAIALVRLRGALLRRERSASWVRQLEAHHETVRPR